MLSIDLIILLIVFAMLVTFFIFEIFALEVTAMADLGVLLIFDVISLDDALTGFSNKAVITIGAMFILSRSLVKTGFLEVFADFIYSHVGNNKWIDGIFYALETKRSVIFEKTSNGWINEAIIIFLEVFFDLAHAY